MSIESLIHDLQPVVLEKEKVNNEDNKYDQSVKPGVNVRKTRKRVLGTMYFGVLHFGVWGEEKGTN